MPNSGNEKCKAVKCKHKATKPSGFCGWCEKKYKAGQLLSDGRFKEDVCRSQVCDRPSKEDGWCGWCIKKFKRGELLIDGSLSLKAEKQALLKKARQSKRAENKKKREIEDLKEEIRSKLEPNKLKILAAQHEEYRKIIGCPHHHIQLDVASCFNRMLVQPKTSKRKGLGLCQKTCSLHVAKLPVLKERLENLSE